ncbi:MAG TPA: hypothetical protein VE954_04405 [Oligoflexus sp.]|uniref:hypothetical protein n=1 Tax=Oligoflexus sp. TaxID=1971216 RepID=UPI002D68E299|nr:hypothetical protein [Oligoflexus sp.]HYX32331.1 hypothetical protein [Oligoflexus sp.]
MESKAKTAMSLTGAGALCGGLISTWLAPKAISWYFMPPAQMGFNCAEPISWALAKLQVAQAFGIIAGAVAGAVLFYIYTKRRKVS